jgi:alkanesulfonate monooxygenase SsuD/methylene tetrahydromethanopterin reductase-like flavin-dependent oxidoreductase (luciferase family)
VVRSLWDSIEPAALVFDRDSEVFGDPAKVHPINFRSHYYNVRGPLPSLRSPQGRPVIIQAGQSGPGMVLAATYADMQFSTRRTIPSMKEHRTNLNAKLSKFGRNRATAASCVRIQVAESESVAMEKERHYLDSIPPEDGLIEMSSMYGADLSLVRRDTPLANLAEEVKAPNTHVGSFEEILKTTNPKMTVEEFGRKYMTERVLVAVGTPEVIADRLETLRFETGANGGFMPARGFLRPAICKSSSIWWCPSCSGAACRGKPTPARLCTKTSCIEPVGSPRRSERSCNIDRELPTESRYVMPDYSEERVWIVVTVPRTR